jgi:hypothetical protein
MKKFIYFALAAVLALSLAACGGKDDAPSGADTAIEENNDINIEEDTYDVSDTTAESGSVSGGDMESAIAGYLSAIGGPSDITLCGGSEIEFVPANDKVGMFGDNWNISDPDMSFDDLVASLDSQFEAVGFTREPALFGWQWVIRAGVQKLGLIAGEDGTNFSIYMTHMPECYTTDYIAEQEAIMPKIIPAMNAFEKLPENFSMTWKTN